MAPSQRMIKPMLLTQWLSIALVVLSLLLLAYGTTFHGNNYFQTRPFTFFVVVCCCSINLLYAFQAPDWLFIKKLLLVEDGLRKSCTFVQSSYTVVNRLIFLGFYEVIRRDIKGWRKGLRRYGMDRRKGR